MKKEEKKQVYILCPRCELNYINKKDKYCTVCKAEIGLIDPSILIQDEEEAGVEKLCPVCHVNYIGEDEDICFLCQKERDEHSDSAIEPEDDWKDFPIDDETEIPEEIPMPLSDDGEEAEEEADEFIHESEPDDFDYDVSPDDFEDDDEYADDEDEDDDEEL